MRHPRNVDPLASVGGREMSAPRGVKPASQAVLIVLAALLLSAQEQPPQQPPQLQFGSLHSPLQQPFSPLQQPHEQPQLQPPFCWTEPP